jgi:hypothetical protein
MASRKSVIRALWASYENTIGSAPPLPAWLPSWQRVRPSFQCTSKLSACRIAVAFSQASSMRSGKPRKATVVASAADGAADEGHGRRRDVLAIDADAPQRRGGRPPSRRPRDGARQALEQAETVDRRGQEHASAIAALHPPPRLARSIPAASTSGSKRSPTPAYPARRPGRALQADAKPPGTGAAERHRSEDLRRPSLSHTGGRARRTPRPASPGAHACWMRRSAGRSRDGPSGA